MLGKSDVKAEKENQMTAGDYLIGGASQSKGGTSKREEKKQENAQKPKQVASASPETAVEECHCKVHQN